MKAIIGIDTNGSYRPTLDLMAKLRFNKPQLTLLHAVTTTCPISCADAHTQAAYSTVVQNLGLTALDASVDEACGRDLKSKTKLVFGRAADCLMREAEGESADLVGVCATHRGSWNSSYLGSATCALAISCPTSLLVAKGPVKKSHGLVAVLATDHSCFSEQWIDRFIEFGVKGISHLHLVSAYQVDDEAAVAMHKNLAMLGGDVERWLYDTNLEKTKALADRLSEAGFKVTFSVEEGPAIDVIRNSMQVHHGELLIIGAHGNTQIAGAKIGSVALHEIVAEPYPVLLIRA